MKYIVIDSGTTNSRMRLCDERGVIKSVRKPVGARDVSIEGNNDCLKKALKSCFTEILSNSRCNLEDIEAIIASGMISSNVGLMEVPHIDAPADISRLSDSIRVMAFPEIVDKEIFFIPGVKIGFDEGYTLDKLDIIRGEETEIFGYLDKKNEKEVLFMHYGSHHKCIKVNKGCITEGQTAITGEILMALSQGTILKSSLLDLSEIVVDKTWIGEGTKMAQVSGFGRALFSTRILDVMEKRSKQEVTNFYLGIILSLDLQMIFEMITERTEKVVLYGKSLFPGIIEDLIIKNHPGLKVITVPEIESDYLSAIGAMKIYNKWKERKKIYGRVDKEYCSK